MIDLEATNNRTLHIVERSQTFVPKREGPITIENIIGKLVDNDDGEDGDDNDRGLAI